MKGGEWPESLRKAHVAFIPKAGGFPAITILSASYKVFSSCMFRQLIAWHDQWCPWPSALCRGRPGADALQTAIELGLALEEAMAIHKRGMLLISLDPIQVFCLHRMGLLDGLAREFGMLANLRSGFTCFLSSLQLKMRVGDTYSC